MNNLFLALYTKFQSLTAREDGQDLVEYGLLVALIALVCVSGIKGVATGLTAVFTSISSALA